MPKFYVHDGLEKTIIIADHPLQACFKAIKHRFEGIPVNGYYKISEKGFENHDDDTVFTAEEVIQALLEMMQEEKRVRKKKRPRKRKKDEDED